MRVKAPAPTADTQTGSQGSGRDVIGVMAEGGVNWAAWLYLLASLAGAALAYNALFPRRRGVYLSSVSWILGLVTGDLAWHYVAWQAAATAGFASQGAFDATPGLFGLMITGAAWVALGWTQVRSSQTAGICQAALREAFGGEYGIRGF